jgi:hypothetical protein
MSALFVCSSSANFCIDVVCSTFADWSWVCSQEYVNEAKQLQAEAREKLAMVDAKIFQVKEMAAQN